MGKLLDIYNNLKNTDSSSLYLFKSGMFYIFLDEDAKKASVLLNLKLTHFTPEILKCGFPINTLDKYLNLLNNMNYDVKIIDTAKCTIYNITEYANDIKTDKLLQMISSINIDTLSISEAYSFIENINHEASEIIEGDKKNE